MAETPWKNLPRKRRHRTSIPSAPWLLSFLLLLLLLGHADARRPIMSPERKLELRDLVKKTWYHGFDNYINHAFPHDELRPISCTGIGHDRENPNNHEINDVLGDFSMTMIDTLDTFVALRDVENFGRAVGRIAGEIRDFDKDSKVQVFETTIRVLGGLLSGHLFAHDPENVWGHRVDGYNGELLRLAKDLADRLLPAFLRSPTGIPYARINLRHGVVSGEGTETCTAGAGSLLLEFATLSRLLGDPIYENVAKRAFYALWDRRSSISLFGNTIDIQTGEWSYGISSIGAGIDSFYEYILKSHILLQDQSFLEIWNQAYKAVMTYMRSPDGFWYRGVNMQTGAVATTTIDSLAAFWPGLQVLAGDVEAAIQSHMIYANLWARYSGIPEVFDIHRRQATSLGYPLRPEFIESNYFLYRATKDEFYLDVAERVLTDLVNRTWVDCGLASISNLVTGQLEDRQHSFMLSETLKYLYLTFDEDNPINHADEPFVFTTEGHILYIPPEAANSTESQEYSTSGWEERESLDSDRVVLEKDIGTKQASKPATCPVYLPSLKSADKDLNPFRRFSIDQRTDFDYARFITGAHHSPLNYVDLSRPSLDQSDWADSFGFCQVPLVHEELIELIFSHSEADIERRPGPEKVEFSASSASGPELVVVKNITGLTFSLKKDWEDDTYEIVQVGGYDLSPKTEVMLTDEYAVKVLKPPAPKESAKISARDRDHLTGIRVFYRTGSSGSEEAEESAIERPVMMATFGPDVRQAGAARLSLGMEALEVVSPGAGNEYGCAPMTAGSGTATVLMEEDSQEVAGKVVVVKRGECTFVDKLQHVYEAGGVGLIVVNTDDALLIPTSDRLPAREDQGSSSDASRQTMNTPPIPLLFAAQETGASIANMLANSSPPDQAPHRRVFIRIRDQPLALLDALNNRHLASSLVVINGYRLRNLKLPPS